MCVFLMTSAEACMICIPYPKKTLADSLFESKTVVLAREKNNKKQTFFSLLKNRLWGTGDGKIFYAVQALKGGINGVEFNAFIDYKDRRLLRLFPEDAVVFRQEDTESNWQYIAYADLDYQEFIRVILRQSLRWEEYRGNLNRIDFFSEYLNHTHQQIREQAHLEVARAPYTTIKRISGTISREQIREALTNRKLNRWHSLYILMLGHSRHPDDLNFIREQLKFTAANGQIENLSAWVTAFIETNPENGVERIENMYFNNKNRTLNELKEVCKSFAVLGSKPGFSATPEFFKRRQRFVHGYSILLENHPLMAGQVAKDLMTWQVRAQVELLTKIIENEPALDSKSKLAITYYLYVSQRFPSANTTR